MEWYDEVVHFPVEEPWRISAVNTRCGDNASRTLRLVGGGNVIKAAVWFKSSSAKEEELDWTGVM